MPSAAETEESARELVAFMRGDESLDTDDRSLGELWREALGTEPSEELGVLDAITQNDAVQAVVGAGAAGLAGAQLASSVLTAIGASSSAVPVVGWVVAAVVVVANTLLSVVTNGRQLAEGRQLGRKQLKLVNEISSLIDRPVPRVERYSDWGDIPRFGSGDAAAAWWHLRTSEVCSVLSSAYMEQGLHGHYRHGFLVDVETSRDYGGSHNDVNEGFPYISYREVSPQIELSSGGSQRTRYYGRGALHIEHDAPFFDFWRGSGPKLQRRMSASLASTQLVHDALRTSGDPDQRRAMIAALLNAAQAQFASRGSRFALGAPENLATLAATLVGPVELAQSQFVLERGEGAPPMDIVAVQTAAPFRMHVGRTGWWTLNTPPDSPIGRKATATVMSDGISPWAIFALPVSAEAYPTGYLIGWSKAPLNRAAGFVVSRADLDRAVRPTVNPTLMSCLPLNHPGTAWLRNTVEMWHGDLGLTAGTRRFPGLFLWKMPPDYDLERGGPDRAGEGGGGMGLLALAALGAYAYSQS